MNIEDSLVAKLLKVFSLKTLDEIDMIVKKHNEKPEIRYGQQELARRVVEVLFGKDAVQQAENISKVLFGGEDIMQTIQSFNKDDIDALAAET
jgi:tyrosyl-tRNA synthetase